MSNLFQSFVCDIFKTPQTTCRVSLNLIYGKNKIDIELFTIEFIMTNDYYLLKPKRITEYIIYLPVFNAVVSSDNPFGASGLQRID